MVQDALVPLLGGVVELRGRDELDQMAILLDLMDRRACP